jgi:protein CLEC16A
MNSLLTKDRFSATASVQKNRKSFIKHEVALFLLSHVLSVITYGPLLNDLCDLIFFFNDQQGFEQMCSQPIVLKVGSELDYLSEPTSLVVSLSSCRGENKNSKNSYNSSNKLKNKSRSKSVPQFSNLLTNPLGSDLKNSSITETCSESRQESIVADEEEEESKKIFSIDLKNGNFPVDTSQLSVTANITDDEKRQQISSSIQPKTSQNKGLVFDSLLSHLNSTLNNEYNELSSLLAVTCLNCIMNNPGLPLKFKETMCIKKNTNHETTNYPHHQSSIDYSDLIISKVVGIISKSTDPDFKVRLATLQLCVTLLKSITMVNKKSHLNDFYSSCVEQTREQSSFILRRYFRSEEMFLDMFEHEYHSLNGQSLNFDHLLRDWSILLAPTSTPLSYVDFTRRFPCGDTEKLKHWIQLFFLMRDLSLCLANESEMQLPLTKQEALVKESDALDLNSSDLIACTVNFHTKEKKERRFLVIDPIQFILVEPEVKRIGWGIVKFSDLIQDVEVATDKEDSRSLNITIKKSSSGLSGNPQIVLNSIFTFDDHIRCMAAKQHLVRARDRARRMKLEKIAQLLDITTNNNNNNKNSSKNMTSTPASSDILSYNLVAGLNMLGTINHPGRATSMISNSWSQISQPEKNGPITSPISPMQAFNRTNSSSGGTSVGAGKTSTSNSALSFYKNQFNSQSSNISEKANITYLLDQPIVEQISNAEKEIQQNSVLDDSNQFQFAKSLITNTDKVDFENESISIVSSKINIIPPNPPKLIENLDNLFNFSPIMTVSKEKSYSNEFTT